MPHARRFIRTISRYLFIGLFVYYLIALSTPSSVHAQDYRYSYPDDSRDVETNESLNAAGYSDMSDNNAKSKFVKDIMGPVEGITVPIGTFKNDPEYAQKIMKKSAISGINNIIFAMYTNPPANTIAFVRDAGQTLGFLPNQTYAQGIGFSGLAPLLPVWKVFRNIAYVILAIILLIIGFMVMLRKKIDPKTVVTVQNSLPKVIVTLLLITFSYAIVGIVIDLMYLLILLMVALFQTTTLLPDPARLAQMIGYTTPQSLYSQGGLVANIWNLFGVDFGSGDTIGLSHTTTSTLAFRILGMDNLVGRGLSAVGLLGSLGLLLLTATGVAIPFAIPGAIALGVAGGLPIILGVLLSIALLFLLIRLFIFFLSNYIQIIIALIFSPIQLLFEAVPGSNAFSNWLNNLISCILVFPIGSAMFMLAAIFINIGRQPGEQLWTPPFTPLVSSSASAVGALLALGVLFTIPNIANQIKEILKPKPFISAGPETIVGALGGPATLGMQVFQLWHSFETTRLLRKSILPKAAQPEEGHAGG